MTHTLMMTAALFSLACAKDLSECEIYEEAVCECDSEGGTDACTSASEQISIAEAYKEDGWTNLYRDAQTVCEEEYEVFMAMGGCGALALETDDGSSTDTKNGTL